MHYVKTILCCLLVSTTLLGTQAQTVLKDKKRGAESFEIIIRNKSYKQFIPVYVLQHASYKKWQQTAKANCKGLAKGEKQTARIKLLVSVNHEGKVFVSDHYSSPSLTEWVDDPALVALVKSIAKDLQLLIQQQGKVKPPYNVNINNGEYYNDETVVEVVWQHKCQ